VSPLHSRTVAGKEEQNVSQSLEETMQVKELVAVSVVLLGLLVTADIVRAQPTWPQGTGSFSGSSSPAVRSRGIIYVPLASSSSATYESYYAPEPQPVGWQKRSDGWFYYWSQGQVVGAYDPDSELWHVYNASTGWGKATTPPWKGR
jgi:hypothetical protein